MQPFKEAMNKHFQSHIHNSSEYAPVNLNTFLLEKNIHILHYKVNISIPDSV